MNFVIKHADQIRISFLMIVIKSIKYHITT